jgi:hypothetical protein
LAASELNRLEQGREPWETCISGPAQANGKTSLYNMLERGWSMEISLPEPPPGHGEKQKQKSAANDANERESEPDLMKMNSEIFRFFGFIRVDSRNSRLIFVFAFLRVYAMVCGWPDGSRAGMVFITRAGTLCCR